MHCSVEHFKLFELARDFKNGAISKSEARELLSRIGVAGCEKFETQTGSVIREILTDDEALSEEETVETVFEVMGDQSTLAEERPRVKSKRTNKIQ